VPLQKGPEPTPAFRVRWQQFSGTTAWREVLDAPRVEEGCLILKPSPGRLTWVPLHTITGPIDVEGI
jgi:hypothetical protein